jgi:CRP/FNR family transcriptional regulator
MTSNQACENCPSKERGLCSALNAQQLRTFSAATRRKFATAGQPVFLQGGESRSYAILLSGAVKLIRSYPNGHQGIAGLLFAPDFAGRIFNPEHTFSVEAATDCTLCIVPSDAFLKLVDTVPSLGRKLFEAAASQLSWCHDWAMLLRQPQAIQRVAGFLHFMSLRTASVCGNSARFQLPLAQREIGGFLGLTKETVSRQMTLMKSLEIIDMKSRRDIMVHDLEMLAALAMGGAEEDAAPITARGKFAPVCRSLASELPADELSLAL